jgi:hypothetical protein
LIQSRLQASAELGGVLYAFAAPVLPDTSIWGRATASAGNRDKLRKALKDASVKTHIADTRTSLNFAYQTDWHQFGSDLVRLSTLNPNEDPFPPPLYALDVDLRRDGSAQMAAGNAVSRPYGSDRNILFEIGISGTLASFLALVSKLYELAGYHGHVDVGAVVVGLTGCHSSTIPSHGFYFNPYNDPEYRRTDRVSASELRQPTSVVTSLLRHLFEETTGKEQFDAFTWTSG